MWGSELFVAIIYSFYLRSIKHPSWLALVTPAVKYAPATSATVPHSAPPAPGRLPKRMLIAECGNATVGGESQANMLSIHD